MPTTKKRSDYINSEEGQISKQKLQRMTIDSAYNTASSYHANSLLYPDNLITFVDKHMNYLSAHPKLDAWMYIANLRLMTRVKK